ncbi:MAG: hypothetical protein IJN96_00430 [Clostridia bacterium]|nr:hypothetical protein [Clostridia bacterium]
MKKILSLVLSVVLVLLFYCQVLALEQNPDTSDWFVWDMPDERQALGTAIDASRFLDAPAGKYGFTEAEGEYIKFVDAEGRATEARFWGTNISTVSMFDDYEKLDELAMRIARSGYNLVRFHAPDLNVDGNNIFGMKNGADTTRVIDPDRLDKIFYLFSKLKEKGVYVYLDLMAYRPILPGDGLDSECGSMTADACFDPKMIELQKEYATQILGTVNPYTGLALKDDPALAFLQLNNENGFTELVVGSYRNPLAYTQEYSKNLLNSLFSTWLKNKYGSDSALKNAWTESGKTGMKDGESVNDGSVFFDYTYANNAEYSEARKEDSNRFVYYTQKQMYTEMLSHLRGMGVKCMITGTSLGLGAQNAVTAALCDEVTDFVDMHSYNGHPTNWFNNGSLFNGFGSSAGRGVNMFWRLGFYRMDKPYIIGEYQSCIPNPYGAETEPMMAVIASFQNWYPLNYDLRSDDKESDMLYCAFQTYNSPARTAVQPSAAIIYHRHDVREAEKALEIPITRDNIINGKYEDWPKAGKIQFGLYTDYVKARYKIYENDAAYNAADKSVYNSVSEEVINRVNKNDSVINDQIVWERDNALMKVTTDYSNMLTGNLSGASYESEAMKIIAQNEAATVTLVALDDNKLKNSEHMLLTAVARERNTDMVMSEEEVGRMIDTGHAPILTEAVTAAVTIKSATPIAVYALDSSGRKKQAVAVRAVSGGYSFNLSSDYETLYYEIERINDGVVYSESDIFTGEVFVSGYTASPSRSVTVKVTAPSGRTYSYVNRTSDATGYFSTAFDLHERAERGTYTVEADFGSGVKKTDIFRYERPILSARDNYSVERRYTKQGDGVTILNGDGVIGLAATVKGNKTVGETLDDGYRISFENTVNPYEFKVNSANISTGFEGAAYVEFDIDLGAAEEKPVLSFRRGLHMLRLDISDYVTESGWQRVRVPLSEFSDYEDFDFGQGEYYIGIGFANKTTADVKLKNMVLGLQLDEAAEYYYKDENVITLAENGAYGKNVVFFADRASESRATVERDYIEDGVHCIRLVFTGNQSAVAIGHPQFKTFEKMETGVNYVLAMRVKAKGDTKGVSLMKTSGGFTDGVTKITPVGMYFNNSENWQTVYIPITENLTDVYGIGFSSGELELFVESMYIIPEGTAAFSRIREERVFSVDKVIFQNGRFGCGYSKYMENNGYPAIAVNGTSGLYGQKTLSLACLGAQGLVFDAQELGITQENYKEKYLRFDIKNINSTVGKVTIGRKGDVKYESIDIGYDWENWQTVFVPITAFSKSSMLSWEDTNIVYIAMGDTSWWRTYELDNIVIGSFIDGEFAEDAKLNSDGNAEFELSNSMRAAYEFVQQGENIFAVKRDGRMKNAIIADPAEKTVGGNSVEKVTVPGITAQSGDTVEWYRWQMGENYVPIKEKAYITIK